MKRFSVVVSLPGHNKYLQEQEVVAKSAADRLGVELRVINAESDPVLQSQQLLEIIQSHTSPMPNAIVVEPVNELGLPRVAEAAVNAGIGWVISNARVDYLESLRNRAQAPVFSVSQDHSDIGRILGRQCGALLPDGGTVLYLRGPASNSLAGRRMEGVESALARNIQLKTIKIQWTEDAAYQTVASWLRLSTVKAKDIHLVASQNTDFILGAIRAFQGNTQGAERTNWMALPFLGVGTASRTKPLVEKGTLRAAVITSLTMDTALDLLVNALEKGSQPPENTFVPASSMPSLQELARKDRTKSAIAAGV